jgi:hypothetical protein
MGGTARVELRDGAVKGINLAEAVNDVRSIVGKGAVKTNDPSKRTDFSEITRASSSRTASRTTRTCRARRRSFA